MPSEPATYPGHRFPAEVIHHAAWLYHVFSLSLRDVELLLAERGVLVSHGSIRRRCARFGADFAAKLRKRPPRPGDTWHLDEVFLRMNGQLFHLWRAVDQHGLVLDILVQERRNATAAERFFRRLLAGLRYKPRRIVTDGLRSYGVAQREVLPGRQRCACSGDLKRRIWRSRRRAGLWEFSARLFRQRPVRCRTPGRTSRCATP